MGYHKFSKNTLGQRRLSQPANQLGGIE